MFVLVLGAAMCDLVVFTSSPAGDWSVGSLILAAVFAAAGLGALLYGSRRQKDGDGWKFVGCVAVGGGGFLLALAVGGYTTSKHDAVDRQVMEAAHRSGYSSVHSSPGNAFVGTKNGEVSYRVVDDIGNNQSIVRPVDSNCAP